MKPELPNDGVTFRVGLFAIDINKVTVDGLKRLRRVVPMD